MNITESDIKEFQELIQREMDLPLMSGGKRSEIYPYIRPGMEKYLPAGIRLEEWSGSEIDGLRCCKLVRCE